MGITALQSMTSDTGTQKNIGNINDYGISSDEVSELIEDSKDYSITENTGDNTITIDQQYIRCNAGETLTLPDSSLVSINPGKRFIFKCTGDASGDAVTIQCAGTDTIDLGTSTTISTNKGYLEVIYTGDGNYDIGPKW